PREIEPQAARISRDGHAQAPPRHDRTIGQREVDPTRTYRSEVERACVARDVAGDHPQGVEAVRCRRATLARTSWPADRERTGPALHAYRAHEPRALPHLEGEAGQLLPAAHDDAHPIAVGVAV